MTETRRLRDESAWLPGHTLFPRRISEEALEAVAPLFGFAKGAEGYELLRIRLNQIVERNEERYATYSKPTPTWYREQLSPLITATENVVSILQGLPAPACSHLEFLISRRMQVSLRKTPSGAPSIENFLQELCDLCDKAIPQPNGPGAKPKEYSRRTAGELIELWEELRRAKFTQTYKRGSGEFEKPHLRFAQIVLKELDPDMTTEQIIHAIREALACRRMDASGNGVCLTIE